MSGPNPRGELEEPTDLIRSALLQLEEGHPAPDHLPPSMWIARVCEQISMLALVVREYGDELGPLDDDTTLELIARLSAVGAEAIRAAARYHPDAREGQSILELTDWTLQVIDEGADDPEEQTLRSPSDVLTASVAILGGAAAGAIALDADQRGETQFPDRVSAMHLEKDPEDAFAESLFHVAAICRAGIAWALEGP